MDLPNECLLRYAEGRHRLLLLHLRGATECSATLFLELILQSLGQVILLRLCLRLAFAWERRLSAFNAGQRHVWIQ
jgi:hypothetical protein